MQVAYQQATIYHNRAAINIPVDKEGNLGSSCWPETKRNNYCIIETDRGDCLFSLPVSLLLFNSSN